MLILSRKKEEKIVVGDPSAGNQVVITLVDIRGDKVRIGIDAKPDVPIHRLEVYQAIYGTEPEKSPQQPGA